MGTYQLVVRPPRLNEEVLSLGFVCVTPRMYRSNRSYNHTTHPLAASLPLGIEFEGPGSLSYPNITRRAHGCLSIGFQRFCRLFPVVRSYSQVFQIAWLLSNEPIRRLPVIPSPMVSISQEFWIRKGVRPKNDSIKACQGGCR